MAQDHQVLGGNQAISQTRNLRHLVAPSQVLVVNTSEDLLLRLARDIDDRIVLTNKLLTSQLIMYQYMLSYKPIHEWIEAPHVVIKAVNDFSLGILKDYEMKKELLKTAEQLRESRERLIEKLKQNAGRKKD